MFNQRSKITIVQELKPCDNNENLPITITKCHLSEPEKNVFSLDGEFVIKEVINGPLSAVIMTSHCEMESHECEHFNDFKFTTACKFMHAEDMVYTPFITKIQPVPSCPLQPGTYSIVNGSADLNWINNLPFEGVRWKVFYKVFDETKDQEKRMIACFWSLSYIIV